MLIILFSQNLRKILILNFRLYNIKRINIKYKKYKVKNKYILFK